MAECVKGRGTRAFPPCCALGRPEPAAPCLRCPHVCPATLVSASLPLPLFCFCCWAALARVWGALPAVLQGPRGSGTGTCSLCSLSSPRSLTPCAFPGPSLQPARSTVSEPGMASLALRIATRSGELFPACPSAVLPRSISASLLSPPGSLRQGGITASTRSGLLSQSVTHEPHVRVCLPVRLNILRAMAGSPPGWPQRHPAQGQARVGAGRCLLN